MVPLLLQAGAALAAGTAPIGCLIEPQRTSEVGSPVIGVVDSVLVERGDLVRAGQPLAVLRSDVEKVSVALAQSRAAAIGELRAAEANAELARTKLARAEDLARQQFISAVALDQARAEAAVAQNRLAQAREQQGIYAQEHELAKAQLELRTIRSPSGGVVAERYVSAGERVEEKPMFRIATVDPLRVEVVLPVSAFAQVRRGTSITVHPEFPGAGPRAARVVLVDRVVEGSSNTFRARLELPNPGQKLPAGIRCKAELAGQEAAAPRPSAQPVVAPAGGLPLRGVPAITPAPRP
jgi:RND family efflux transporter MFP subunit